MSFKNSQFNNWHFIIKITKKWESEKWKLLYAMQKKAFKGFKD